jgi:hypothetical protein
VPTRAEDLAGDVAGDVLGATVTVIVPVDTTTIVRVHVSFVDISFTNTG